MAKLQQDFAQSGIDWKGRGYFGCPTPPAGVAVSADPFVTWEAALVQAKAGHFDSLPQLIDLYKASTQPVLLQACAFLLGDAGPAACFQRIRQEVESSDSFELVLDFCDAIAARGKLADVPLLLGAYEKFATVEDADIIPCYLSALLEPVLGALSDPNQAPSLAAYRALVLKRYDQLSDDLGTDQVLVWMGEPFGVVPMAKRLLELIRNPSFPSDLRRKFEAATGIDCTAFYKAAQLQPLTVAAILERFLDSPAADHYQDGVRYFFGHRIPD